MVAFIEPVSSDAVVSLYGAPGTKAIQAIVTKLGLSVAGFAGVTVSGHRLTSFAYPDGL